MANASIALCAAGEHECPAQNVTTVAGDAVCAECRDTRERCADCARWTLADDLTEINGDRPVCPSCAAQYEHCDQCDGEVRSDRMATCDQCGERICDHCDHYHDDSDASFADRPYRIVSSLYEAQDPGTIIRSRRKFGVEIECQYPNGTAFETVASRINSAIGIASDGSISGRGVEYQVPPAAGRAAEALLTETCRSLIGNGFSVDRSCGLHIHVGAEDFLPVPVNTRLIRIERAAARSRLPEGSRVPTREIDGYRPPTNDETENARRLAALKFYLSLYIAFGDVLLSFMPLSRRSSSYCEPLRPFLSLGEVSAAGSHAEIEALWYRTPRRRVPERKRVPKDSSRYRGLNAHALFSAGHAEIRYHSGTINPLKILHWANLNLAMADTAQAHSREGGSSPHVFIEAMQEIRIEAKTEILFSLIGLSPESRAYFADRQQKFRGAEGEGSFPTEPVVAGDNAHAVCAV